MAFDHADYIRSFLMVPGQNGAAKYGVSITPAVIARGQTYWRVIGVHHLTGSENGGKNNVFLDVLDEQGQRMGPPWPLIDWTWEGKRDNERAGLVVLDKPPNEPGGNIGLHAGQIASVWVAGRPSDKVIGLQTAGVDDPNEEPGNHRYHHSFYVVFQRTKAEQLPPIEEPVEAPTDDPQAPVEPVEEPPAPGTVYTHTAATFYLISAGGTYIGQVTTRAWAERIIAALKLAEASDRDHSIDSYVEGLRGLAEDD